MTDQEAPPICCLCSRADTNEKLVRCPNCPTWFHSTCLAAAGRCPVCAGLSTGEAAAEGGRLPADAMPGFTTPEDCPEETRQFHPLSAMSTTDGLGSFTTRGRSLQLEKGDRALELTQKQGWALTRDFDAADLIKYIGVYLAGFILISILVSMLEGIHRGASKLIGPFSFSWFFFYPFLVDYVRRWFRSSPCWLVRERSGRWLIQYGHWFGETRVGTRWALHVVLVPESSPQANDVVVSLSALPNTLHQMVLRIGKIREIPLTPPLAVQRTKDPSHQWLTSLREATQRVAALLGARVEESWITERREVAPELLAPAGKATPPAATPKPATGAPAGRCQICGMPSHIAEIVACPSCETLHHKDCWEWSGGCSTYGCEARSRGTAPGELTLDAAAIAAKATAAVVAPSTVRDLVAYDAAGQGLSLGTGQQAIQVSDQLVREVRRQEFSEPLGCIVAMCSFPVVLILLAQLQPAIGHMGVLLSAAAAIFGITRSFDRWRHPDGSGLAWIVKQPDGMLDVAYRSIPLMPLLGQNPISYTALRRTSGKLSIPCKLKCVVLRRGADGTLLVGLEMTELGWQEILRVKTPQPMVDRHELVKTINQVRHFAEAAAGLLRLPYREEWTLSH